MRTARDKKTKPKTRKLQTFCKALKRLTCHGLQQFPLAPAPISHHTQLPLPARRNHPFHIEYPF